jgi:hypothetical protein
MECSFISLLKLGSDAINLKKNDASVGDDTTLLHQHANIFIITIVHAFALI